MRFFIPWKRRNGTLRLRIIANSDSAEDQAAKISMRDALLPIARQTPVCLDRMRKAALLLDPSARVSRGVHRFAGYASDTVLVTLGAGQGHNWWCVLFPTEFGLDEEPAQFESIIINLLKSWGLL